MSMARFARVDHAWHIVAAGFVVSMITTGFRFAAGPFMSAITTSLGLSHTEFSAIVAVSLVIYGLCMPVAGRLADLLGGRAMLTAGGLLLCASLAVSAWTSSPLIFAVAFAGTASFGFAATSQVTLSAVVGRWFDRRRGLAMTIVGSGAMAGIALMVPVSAGLIQ